MEYLSVSFTYKNTDINTREKLAFNNELEKIDIIKKLLIKDYINEVVIISTCNRVEIILNCSIINKSISAILKLLSLKSGISTNILEDLADIYENENAVYHIFMVASSLDSLVVGETQIVGQLKEAFYFSKNNNFCKNKLTKVFESAFKCAREVRKKTNLGSGSTSVASAAVSGAKKYFPNGATALVVGSGEMSELATKHLLKNNFEVIICSRNFKKASLLKDMIVEGNEKYKDIIKAQKYDNLQYLLNSCEVLISATSAPYPIIKNNMVKKIDFKRYWFDIAIPRDIDDIECENLTIFRVDDLKAVVQESMQIRAEKAKEAISIVKNSVSEFFNTLNRNLVDDFLKNIHLSNYKKAQNKLNIAIKKGFISGDNKNNIEKLLKNIINEIFYKSSKEFKKNKNYTEDNISFLNKLFGE